MSTAVAIDAAGVVPRAGQADGAVTAAEVVEVAVLLPVPGTYHYRVPAALQARAQVGARVLVEFGRRKVSGVIVRGAGDTVPAPGAPIKSIAELLDDEAPALGVELVALCAWIADYYKAPLGEVLRAA